jgi:hypothetical protein
MATVLHLVRLRIPSRLVLGVVASIPDTSAQRL